MTRQAVGHYWPKVVHQGLCHCLLSAELLFICNRIKKGEGQRVKNVTLKLYGVRKTDKTIK
jgi:hypothetical protein